MGAGGGGLAKGLKRPPPPARASQSPPTPPPGGREGRTSTYYSKLQHRRCMTVQTRPGPVCLRLTPGVHAHAGLCDARIRGGRASLLSGGRGMAGMPAMPMGWGLRRAEAIGRRCTAKRSAGQGMQQATLRNAASALATRKCSGRGRGPRSVAKGPAF